MAPRGLAALVLLAVACSREGAPEAPPATPLPPPAPAVAPPPAPAPPAPPPPLAPHGIAVDERLACARTSDGHVVCWGELPSGAALPSPVGIAGLADIAGVALGKGGLLAWSRDGAAWRWNGDGATRLSVKDVEEIAASDDAACARSRAGEVACWVAGGAPVHVLGGAAHVVVAPAHACALVGADVTCWALATPAQRTRIARAHGATALAGGGRSADTLAAVVAGRVVAWTADGAAVEVPAAVPADTSALAIGGADICALGATVSCWDDLEHPVVRAFAGVAGARELALGTFARCAAMPDHSVKCWGPSGFVGDGQPMRTQVPVEVTGLDDAVQLAAGWQGVCARRASGTGACWGTHGNDHDLHLRESPADLMPVAAPPPRATGRATSWSGSWFRGDYTCSRDGHAVSCRVVWHAHGEADEGPAMLPLELDDAVAVQMPKSQENEDLCVVRPTGVVECAAMDSGPAMEIPQAKGARDLTQGPAPPDSNAASSTCAATPAGRVVCWTLAVGDAAPKVIEIRGLTDAVEVAGNEMVACARRKTGHVACWGSMDHAGAGPRPSTDTPSVVPGVTL